MSSDATADVLIGEGADDGKSLNSFRSCWANSSWVVTAASWCATFMGENACPPVTSVAVVVAAWLCMGKGRCGTGILH